MCICTNKKSWDIFPSTRFLGVSAVEEPTFSKDEVVLFPIQSYQNPGEVCVVLIVVKIENALLRRPWHL